MKRLVLAALARSGVPAIVRRRQRDRLLVVCYHGVRADDAPDRHWLLLPQRELARQVAFLARHYDVLPLDDAVDRLRAGTLRRPTAAITFDDGYRNNRTLALPVLAAHRAPATIFLATGLIGTPRILWTVAVDLAFTNARRTEVAVPEVSPAPLLLDTPASRADAARRVNSHAKTLAPGARRALLTPLLAALDAPEHPPSAPFAMLDWDEVADMEHTGLITFGPHTVNHEIVSRLDDAALAAEIAGSTEAVRAHAAAPSRVFCYPNGRTVDFDARAERHLRAAGHVAALSTIEGLASADDPPYALRRVVVGADMSFDDFVVRTAMADAFAARRGVSA